MKYRLSMNAAASKDTPVVNLLQIELIEGLAKLRVISRKKNTGVFF